MTEADKVFQDYEDFKTIKWLAEINLLIRQYYSIPYMSPELTEEQELENYEKRMELRKRIKLLQDESKTI